MKTLNKPNMFEFVQAMPQGRTEGYEKLTNDLPDGVDIKKVPSL